MTDDRFAYADVPKRHSGMISQGGYWMAKPYILTGTLKDERTIILDEASPLKSGRVLVTLEPLRPEPPKPYQEVMAAIRQRQRARGHQPPTREEIDAYLKS
jgi:hypothetical protein